MITTVDEAFENFQRNIINLDPAVSKAAKKSKDWLLAVIGNFHDSDESFPLLFPEKHIEFGSFARKTKNRELDDIDIMIAIHAQHATYSEQWNNITIETRNCPINLTRYRHDDSNLLNSRKIINKFISNLKGIPQYEKAEINRNSESAVLNLKSYPYSFDIVPCFVTSEDYGGKTFYLIPDGDGHWKKTDPRIDKQFVEMLAARHGNIVLDVIRIMKFWNKRRTAPVMPSYLLETLVLGYWNQVQPGRGTCVSVETNRAFDFIKNNIFAPIMDIKEIQGDLNILTRDQKTSISERAAADSISASNALVQEVTHHNHRSAIGHWQEIFGPAFPQLG